MDRSAAAARARRSARASRRACLPAGASAGAGLLVLALTLDLPAADLAAPGPGRRAAVLDELLEALEVTIDAPVVGAEHVTDALRDVGGLPMHLDLDLGLVLARRS